MKKIIPDIYKTVETYRMDSLQRSIMGAIAEENRVTTDIKKSLLDVAGDTYLYRITILHRRQSNLEGIRKLENRAAMMWDGVCIETDSFGLVTRIANIDEMYAKWMKIYPTVEKEAKHLDDAQDMLESIDKMYTDPEVLKSVFCETDTGTLLFPPVYNRLEGVGEQIEQEKTYHDFFGKVSLPLQLTTTLADWNVSRDKITVVRQGRLNETAFDHREMARHFKVLADDLTIRADLTGLRYAETFDFDCWRWLTHAGQVFYVDIHNLFHYEQIVRVTPLPM